MFKDLKGQIKRKRKRIFFKGTATVGHTPTIRLDAALDFSDN